jgi:RimJ/RimL family protein N-acetyltransferase
MGKFLLYIKHNLKPIWKVIEHCNEIALKIMYHRQIAELENRYGGFTETSGGFCYRLIGPEDADKLHSLLAKLDKDYTKFFNPHGFTREELRNVLTSKNLLTFGYFQNSALVGYFMLRLFVGGKTFLGYVLDPLYAGRGIGRDMVRILYGIASDLGWEAYATISEHNIASLKLHKYKVVKKLTNNYILVRYID